MLNGAKFTVVGGNAYWIGLTGLSTANMNAAFADIVKAGGTAVRTWYAKIPSAFVRFIDDSCRGFNEVTSPNGNYYQSWSGSTPTINAGASGLQNFGTLNLFLGIYLCSWSCLHR